MAGPAQAAGVTDLRAPTLTSSAASATGVSYYVEFTSPSALSADSTITVTMPAGTVLSGVCRDAGVFIRTTNENVGWHHLLRRGHYHPGHVPGGSGR